jgi:hypothetical protein
MTSDRAFPTWVWHQHRLRVFDNLLRVALGNVRLLGQVLELRVILGALGLSKLLLRKLR